MEKEEAVKDALALLEQLGISTDDLPRVQAALARLQQLGLSTAKP
jgi:DNA-directed RNA polymerase subunit H (RpoH/RPB5)